MADNLEDFLRRAAQRRQEKAAQQAQTGGQPPKRQPPQYSDSRTERVTRTVVHDEPTIAAEIVEEQPHPMAARMQQLEEAKQVAIKAQKEAQARAQQVKAKAARSKRPAEVAPSAHPVHELLRTLRQPGGIQQAILLREILDRPVHRW